MRSSLWILALALSGLVLVSAWGYSASDSESERGSEAIISLPDFICSGVIVILALIYAAIQHARIARLKERVEYLENQTPEVIRGRYEALKKYTAEIGQERETLEQATKELAKRYHESLAELDKLCQQDLPDALMANAREINKQIFEMRQGVNEGVFAFAKNLAEKVGQRERDFRPEHEGLLLGALLGAGYMKDLLFRMRLQSASESFDAKAMVEQFISERIRELDQMMAETDSPEETRNECGAVER